VERVKDGDKARSWTEIEKRGPDRSVRENEGFATATG
jgi:hypothetical protein